MSEHSCGSGCGCGPKASSAPTATSIQNGKGSAPRNMSKTFRSNYDGIRWDQRGKARKEGEKFVKVYS
ncbi:MAG: hypothetical protein PW734_05015 [Verrucomicrobium sp.]|nr:hypothetical protein [Verrucomicrobium sp.]